MRKSITTSFLLFTIFFLTAIFSYSQETPNTQEVKKIKALTESAIDKSLELIPENIKVRLLPFRDDIVKGAIPTIKDPKKDPEPYYFVSKKIGIAPRLISDQYKLVEKNMKTNVSDNQIALSLGKLARYIIFINQPYHTDQTLYSSPEHEVFEQQLDNVAEKLDSTFDGYKNIENPAQFTINIAVKSNTLLSAIKTVDINEINRQVFMNSVNDTLDIWLTLFDNASKVSAIQNVSGQIYIGNKNSQKFHLQKCRFLPGEKNRILFNNRQDAISKGYVPCKICKP